MLRPEGVGGRARASTPAVPPVGAWAVRRPRLEAALDAGDEARVTVVCGPRGTGKTSLLAGWAHRLVLVRGPDAVRWLAPDPRARPDEVVERLAARPHGSWPLTVVVDDVTDERLVAGLAEATARRRDQIHLVVGVEQHRLSPLPGTDERATLIGPDALWLDPDEAEEIVRSRFPALTDLDVTEARRIGAGWASAVVSAAQAITHARPQHGEGSGAHEPWLDLRALDELAAPLVDRLPADERATLLAVARHDLLERDDVLGLTGTPTALDHLARAAESGGLVTGARGTSGAPWVLHPVLRRYLRYRTSADGPERVVAVLAHRRALQYFGARGERARAVQHATAGQDPDTIVDALMEHGPSLLAELREDVFDAALTALPDDVAENEPSLVAVRALRHRVSGNVIAGLRDAARLRELDKAAAATRSPLPRSARHVVDRVLLALWEARYGLVAAHEAVASASTMLIAIDAGDQAELCTARRSWLSFELGAVNLWLGDVSQAALWTERGTTVAELDGSPRLLAAALAHRSVIEVVDGAYAAAAESARTSLGVAASSHLLTDPYTARAHVAAACTSFAHLDPESAWDHLASLEQMPPDELDPTVLTLARVTRGRLLTLEGDHEPAWEVLSGRSLRRADLPPQLGRLVAVARAELAAARWDVSALQREAQELDDLGHPQDGALFRGVAAMLAGDVPRARALLGELLQGPMVLPATGAAAAACLVRLTLAVDGGEAARPLLPDLLSRVATGAVDMLLVIAAGGDGLLADLLTDEARLPGGHPYAATALERLGRFRHRQAPVASGRDGSPGHRPREVVSRSLLTDREAAVLGHLRDGMSYEGIGHALFITPNTVKTHVRSLYRKLGVERAGQAVRRGRELGLLPPS
ncbi:LuxR C-terminal-related transcriptional regulator [Actinotalea sp. K2]|uniref:helix-turn-helix transcriptional regulator n=1 Tax=Actinotalea sp. K2 TaxID=2939438 RepID=UPI0020180193|nr:LuxR C-terminal-related transcriptional regulator [Actinotalea sp. K2]MCL3861903.1 LuxR C-terminal-related transcriptional regulator [Actinotalea sp. K2]